MHGFVEIIQFVGFVRELKLTLKEMIEKGEQGAKRSLLLGKIAKYEKGFQPSEVPERENSAVSSKGAFVKGGEGTELVFFGRQLGKIFFQEGGAAFLIGAGGGVKGAVSFPVEAKQPVALFFDDVEPAEGMTKTFRERSVPFLPLGIGQKKLFNDAFAFL